MDIFWRPYQIACKRAIKENYDKGISKQLIVQATGTGKRLQAVNLAKHFDRTLFIAHREELIMQAYEEINQYWPMQVGIIKASRFELEKRIVVASVQTLYNKLDKIAPNIFALVIIDECFPAETLVDGIRIEDFEVGWTVNSFNHDTGKREDSIVTKIMKRKYSGRLYNLGYFKCTPNHPIFVTEIGYCLAKEIYYAYICYKVMSYGFKSFTKSKLFKLWERIFLRRIRIKQDSIHGFSQKRFWMLLSKMQKGIFQQDSFQYYEQDKSQVRFCPDEEKQSNVQSSIDKQNEKIFKRKNIFVSWWKRRTNKTADYYCGIDPFTNGISNNIKITSIIRNKPTKMLQGRFGLFRGKTSNRNRREDSPLKTLEILRQAKNGSIEKSRLESIKIYKRRSEQKSGKNSKENYVYNLEVKGNNNYFANTVLVHNCHHYVSRTYLKCIRHFTPKLCTGWTATPKRLDGLSLSNIFDDIIFKYHIEDGIRDGYLAPMEAYQIKTATDISDVKKTAGDFNIKQLSEKIDSELRNNLIVHKYKEYTPGMQGIAYCVDMDHAYNLRDKFIMNGISCATIVSDKKRCPDRTEIIKGFRNGEIDVITNVNILTEGFDYDDIGCILMCRPTQSETLYIQSIGRGTRQKSLSFIEKHDTKKCTVLDFVDNTGKHSLVNAWELEKGKPIEDRIFLPEKIKQLLLIEKEKRDRRLTVLYGTDKKINLVKLPEVNPWNSAKMYDPATEKQLKWIKDMGVYQEGIEYTKAMASELIGGQEAADWQLQWLGREKYDVSNGATLGQFQKVKWMREKKAKYEIENKEIVDAQNLKNSLL